MDADTGLLRFGWRNYDPKVGRFTAPDPANDRRGDGDVYDYCVDDPVSRKGATGLAWGAIPRIAAAAQAAWLTRGPAAVKNAKDFFSSLAMPPSASANSAEVAGTVTSRYGDDVWDFVKRLPQRQRDIKKRWDIKAPVVRPEHSDMYIDVSGYESFLENARRNTKSKKNIR